MAHVGDILDACERQIADIEVQVSLLERGRDAVKIGDYWNELVKANEVLRQAKRHSPSWIRQWRIYRIRKRTERVLDLLEDIQNPPRPFSLVLTCLLCLCR